MTARSGSIAAMTPLLSFVPLVEMDLNGRIWTPPRLQAFRSLAARYDCSRIFGH